MRARPRVVRRKKCIDESIQVPLVVALVLLEISLACAAAGLLYLRLDAVIDENLYRIHLAGTETMLGQLLRQAAVVLGAFVAVNAAVLLAADWIWRRRVNRIVRELILAVRKASSLDYTPDPAIAGTHPALALAANWREKERARLWGIREAATGLDATAGEVATRAAFTRISRLLPGRGA